jgi:hypothetical protein
MKYSLLVPSTYQMTADIATLFTNTLQANQLFDVKKHVTIERKIYVNEELKQNF